ncbi:hypothetical protein [Delftia tsuruhatensis]|uniref:hypothetical protein n=1 Tax=Delftia tsuruhatensis TaxID=180282 RepID=UPI002AD4B958|nr:hypothetical protein [Delftia tsuruhatensis]WQM81693.1 hypothetical protein RNT40_23740 [Delftia tsuruhatensis]
MTDIVTIPDVLPISPYPALGSINFNNEAYAYATSVPPAVSRMREIAVACRTCAVAAQEYAQTAQAAALTATTQADAAMGYRNQAGNSATAAASSASTAASAASYATAALATMQVMYLGSKAVTSHPTTDNMGNPLQAGALYTNTGTNASINKRGWWWDGAMWQLAWGEFTGAYLPITGGVLQGHLSVPAGATGNQVPRANEVVPRAVAYFDKSTPMSAAPVSTVCFFESSNGGGADWPYSSNVAIHGWLVETWDRGGARSMQEATFTLSGFLATGAKFRRYKHDAVWSAWGREISDLDFRERVVTANTGVGPGDAKVYVLDPSKGSIHQLTVEYNTYFTGGLRDLGDQITLRLKFSGGAWPISFNTNFRFPAGTAFPTYVAGQTLTLTFFKTEGSFIDAFIAGVHNP